MKITACIILIGCLHLSAKTVSQTITISGKNLPLAAVFAEVEKQTGFLVLTSYQLLEKGKPVTVSVTNQPLRDFIREIFRNQSLSYTIKDKTISIREKLSDEGKSLPESSLHPSFKTIRGIVTTSEGQPLAAATVKIKGSSAGVTTDIYGKFEINAEPGQILVISYVGFTDQELTIKGEFLEIKLAAKTSPLDEILLKGYYSSSKRLNTGNVSTLKSEDIEKQPVNNALLALQGRAPGVFITQSSGLPNSTVKVQIRGTNSIEQGKDPLFIIDGVPYTANMLPNVGSSGAGEASPLSFINPSSIESIDVLKDADATAIYGSRGANGVILITTKNGRGQSGAPKFDINLYTGISKIPAKADLMNRDQYLEMRNEGFRNSGAVKSISNAPDLLLWDTTRNEDWQEQLLGEVTRNTDAQVSVTGGGNNSSYRIFGGYNRTTPPFPGNFKSDKLSGGISVSTSSANKRFNAQVSVNYLIDNTFLPSYNPVTGIMLAPVAPKPFNADGSVNYKDYSTNNPFPGFYTTYKGKTTNLVTNASLSYRIYKSLLFKVSGGYNNSIVNGNYAYSIRAQIGNPFISSPSPTASFSYNTMNSKILEPQLSYQGFIGRGRWEALVGTSFQENNNDGQLLYATGYTSDAQLSSLASSTAVIAGGSVYDQTKFTSVYARLNYNLNDKYLVNLTGRRDGGSRFGPDKKFGNFGAIGIGWVFSKENLIADNLSFLSFGKLRGSYGITGNEPGANYQYLSLHSFYNVARPYQNAQSIIPENPLSADFAWEQIKKFEVGLELGFLKDRILTTFSYFKNHSGNQLLYYDLPQITGFQSVFLNRNATVQNTGLEITLNTQNIKSSPLTWSTNFNFTVSKNKLVAFPGIESTPYQYSLIVGQPLSILKRYRAAGVDPQTGVYKFYDKDGKSTFTPGNDDLTETISTDPKFYGGIQNSFTYKNFGLDIFFQFVKQLGYNYYFLSPQAPGRSYYGDGNQPVAVLDRWQKPGDIATYQKFTSTSNPFGGVNPANAYAYQQYSNAAYRDASFIRLKNVSLSYNVPKPFLRKLKMDQARFYFQAQNLFTITSYKGLDPEGQGTTPPLSVWTFGAQFTF